jgi:hypothetical protein
MAAKQETKKAPPKKLEKRSQKDAQKETVKEVNPDTVDLDSLSASDLKASADAAEKALQASGIAQKLRSTASTITDPKKREKYLRDAYDKEVEAHGNSKKARMLTSGAFQGGVGGAGIGTAVGAGVGTLVGTLVGTVAAIPTTGVGALVGSGVGAAHGPWIKLPPIGGGKKKDEDKKEKSESKEETEDKSEGKGEGNVDVDVEDDDDVLPNPEALRKAADEVAKRQSQQKEPDKNGQQGERKKPRKLEVRSQRPVDAGA